MRISVATSIDSRFSVPSLLSYGSRFNLLRILLLGAS